MSAARIAVAGAGLIGRRHARLVQESDSCELSAIVDLVPGAGELAREIGAPVYAALSDLFASEEPDGVIVATPNALHVEHGLECVKHGVPSLIEKPLADSVEEAVRLTEASEAAGVPLLVGHHRRHNPILAKARQIVREGALGPIVAVMGSALFYKPDDYFEAGPWRGEAGGGPILINMIHEVDALRWTCGEIATVQAMSSDATRGFPVEDTVAISLRFASGALGTFILSDTAASARSWEQTSGENASYPSYPEDSYLISGTRGSLSIPTMRLKIYAGKRSWWEPFQEETIKVEPADPLVNQLEHFCAVIRGDAQPLVTGREGVQTLRATLAIHRSSQTTDSVQLPYAGLTPALNERGEA